MPTIAVPLSFEVEEVGRLVAGGDHDDLTSHVFNRPLTPEECTLLWADAVAEIVRQHWWFRSILDKRLMDDSLYLHPELGMYLKYLRWHYGHNVSIEPNKLDADVILDMLAYEDFLATIDDVDARKQDAFPV